MGAKRRLEAIGGEERWIDPTGQLAKSVERLVGILFELGKDRSSATVGFGEGLGHADLDLERDQVLLRAVVQVPLDPPPFLVLGGDEPLT
jgi:hypothetical protein